MGDADASAVAQRHHRVAGEKESPDLPFPVADQAEGVPQRQVGEPGEDLLLDRHPEGLPLRRQLLLGHERGLGQNAHRKPHPVIGHEVTDVGAGNAPALGEFGQFERVPLQAHFSDSSRHTRSACVLGR